MNTDDATRILLYHCLKSYADDAALLVANYYNVPLGRNMEQIRKQDLHEKRYPNVSRLQAEKVLVLLTSQLGERSVPIVGEPTTIPTAQRMSEDKTYPVDPDPWNPSSPDFDGGMT